MRSEPHGSQKGGDCALKPGVSSSTRPPSSRTTRARYHTLANSTMGSLGTGGSERRPTAAGPADAGPGPGRGRAARVGAPPRARARVATGACSAATAVLGAAVAVAAFAAGPREWEWTAGRSGHAPALPATCWGGCGREGPENSSPSLALELLGSTSPWSSTHVGVPPVLPGPASNPGSNRQPAG